VDLIGVGSVQDVIPIREDSLLVKDQCDNPVTNWGWKTPGDVRLSALFGHAPEE